MGEATIYEKKDHIGILTMNRPDVRNAMNAAMRTEMGQVFQDFKNDPDTWVLIITGAGDKSFSAGMDLREMSNRLQGMTPGQAGGTGAPAPGSGGPGTPSIISGNIEIFKPIIAAINGTCVGGGLELALACDLRIAVEGATLGLPEAKRGIVPGGKGTIRLPRLVPIGVAMEMLLTGDAVDAREALRIGLVNQVVPASELMDAAKKMAARIADCAPLAVQSIKATVLKTMGMTLDEALTSPNFGPSTFGSEDSKEGTKAFTEKRKPVWKGR
jgi:enoyl-CoA hydratase/carnithine racemase